MVFLIITFSNPGRVIPNCSIAQLLMWNSSMCQTVISNNHVSFINYVAVEDRIKKEMMKSKLVKEMFQCCVPYSLLAEVKVQANIIFHYHHNIYKLYNQCIQQFPCTCIFSPCQTDLEKTHQTRVEKLARILSGEMTIEQHLQFLIANNHTDMLILRHSKEAVRASVCHTATVIANAFMHCGTTSDQFLR